MIPKEIKCNMHYDDVRGDFLRPLHSTTPAKVEQNKSKKKIAFGEKEHTKSRKSETRFDWVSSYATL